MGMSIRRMIMIGRSMIQINVHIGTSKAMLVIAVGAVSRMPACMMVRSGGLRTTPYPPLTLTPIHTLTTKVVVTTATKLTTTLMTTLTTTTTLAPTTIRLRVMVMGMTATSAAATNITVSTMMWQAIAPH